MNEEDDVIGFEYTIDASKVDDYLRNDADVTQVIGSDPLNLSKYALSKELAPWKLFLAMSIKFNREPGIPPVERPLYEEGVYAYLRCGEDETYTQWSLEWSAYYEDWISRLVDVENSIIKEDSEDIYRFTTFEKAWEVFCSMACKDQGSHAAEAMRKLLIQKPAGFKHTDETEPKANPVVSAPSRPQTFGTWS
ncbi:Uncharacterised protein [Ectopseudomonas mendocina]|uniref:Uncharacterized protein n=1 Tax=Ectopseudomonas mendocina TaxID=300 RepID=A0A379PNW9_ECTME|nr:hypothetical protein [Pseudomonas mendocina]SUE95759.1 Uncharacterised protein [Pseudomonas mendocina]